MTAKQKANRERFKKVVAEAKKLRKKNPKLTQAQAVKQAWAIMYSKKKVSGYSEVGNVPLSKYEVGDNVYSYQNKTKPAKIVYKKFVPWESLSKPNLKDKFVYKLKLDDGFSNWINEESLSKRKTGMGAVKKKSAPKKSSSYHKDTKSHNVNIRVISGIDDQMSAIRNNLEKSIDYYMKRIAMIQNAYGRLSASEKLQAKKIIKRYKTTITKLLKQLRETNQLIAKNVK